MADAFAEKLSLRFGRSRLPWTPSNAEENMVLHPERLGVPHSWRQARSVGTAFVLAFVALWIIPGMVTASLWLTLDPAAGAKGTIVRGATAGSGAATLARSESLPLFLIPPGMQVEDPSDKRLTRLGELIVDANGDGTTTFSIPDVEPGQYDVLVHCEPCAPASAGRDLFVVAELGVSSALPTTDTDDPGDGGWVFGTLALTGALAMAFALDRMISRRPR